MNSPLRRTRGDLIATAVIAALTVGAVGTAYLTAPIRSSELVSASEEHENYGQLAVVPEKLTESFRLPDTSPNEAPLVVNGMIITVNDGTITATTPEGDTAWTYSRDKELCGLAGAWDKVVANYRGNAGCGDVVGINVQTGEYASTRSAPGPEHVATVVSNDRIGQVDRDKVELWRSDLVRTVEYGTIEAPQEPDLQPNECPITSALTRTELLAVTEECNDETFLRFQKATPEDSREPEMHGSVQLTNGSYLVAISQDAAAIYDPESSEIRSYQQDGKEITASKVPSLGEPRTLDDGTLVLPTQDLPHHMSYFQDDYLVLMDPAELSATGVFQGALGTGFSAGDRLLYASEKGVAVVNWDKNSVDTIIPVDRGDYSGPVSINSAGATVVEKRGDEVVVLSIEE